MKRSRVTRTVNFADCDPAHIVFYPTFYQWFDRGTEMLFRSVDLHWEKMMGSEMDGEIWLGVPLVDTSARFMFPCRFGDVVEVESWIDETTDKTFTVRHDVHNQGRLACEGREVRVWAVKDPARPSGIRAMPIPEQILALFAEES
ncbi:MAG: thioesterase family protein [Alphaproteobacteria bacterium]|nr:thioesterase family protein [Alphaproteobacteria bacterium]